MRESKVILIDDAETAFKELNKIAGEQLKKGVKNSEEQQLLKSIKNKVELIKENPAYGDKIQKKLWPKELARKYNLTNLWRIELTNYWRMIYTIKGNKIEVISFIIRIMNHKEYNKLFKYKNR